MPTIDKRPLKVFLCHAHSDAAAVRALYNRLTKDGVDAWFDKEKLLPGQDWELEIRKAVRECDVVVVCLSRQFNQAGFRQKEVRWALDTAMEQPEGEIFIIPARLEVCNTLESLRKWQWVDLFELDGYEKLISALQVRASAIKTLLPTLTLNVGENTSTRNTAAKDNRGPKKYISALLIGFGILYIITAIIAIMLWPLYAPWIILVSIVIFLLLLLEFRVRGTLTEMELADKVFV